MPKMTVEVIVKDDKGLTTKATLLADKDTQNCYRFSQPRTEDSTLFGSIYVLKAKGKGKK